MATIKVACPKCGQKVSGDEYFYGTTVECPVCSARIRFPGERRDRPPLPGAFAASSGGGAAGSGDGQAPAGGEARTAGAALGEAASAPRAAPADGEAPGMDAHSGRFGEGLGDDLPPEAPPPPQPETASTPTLPPADPVSPVWGAVSLISALLGILTCVGGVVFAPVAVACGHTALAKARHSRDPHPPGRTLGLIGVAVGYFSLLSTIAVLVLLVYFGDLVRELVPWNPS